MRKEVVFAITLGLILGLVVLYGLRLADRATKSNLPTTPTISPTTTPATSVSPTLTNSTLTIISPQNQAIVSTSVIKIIGRTLPNSTIAMQNNQDDLLVESDAAGNFVADFSLEGGENVIQITALSPTQTTENTTITVFYTTAKLN